MGIFSKINQILINGVSHQVNGNNISIKDDKIFVNGVLVESGLSGIVKVEFTGDLANLDCASATITGSVFGDVDGTTINCGNVGGDVDGTSINCGDVSGDVDGTTINCGNVGGDVDGVTIKRK